MENLSSWNNFRRSNPDLKLATAKWGQMKQIEKDEYKASKAQTPNILCCLSRFTRILNKLDLNSRVLLAETPFSFLLKLRGYKLDTDLIQKLVADFDLSDNSLMVNDKRFVITEEDFKLILKLENNDPIKKQRCVPAVDINRDLFFTKVESGKVSLCMELVEKALENHIDVENFKRAFALLCIKYILYAPANGKVTTGTFNYIKHTENLKNQPWATFAMDWLVSGIKSYKKSNAVKKSIGGCMVFLQLYYYNKLTNKTPEDIIKEGVKSSLWFDDDDVSENQQQEIAILAEKDYEAWHGVGDLPIDSCSHLEMTDEKYGKEEEEDMNNYVDMGKDEVVHKHEDEDSDEDSDEEVQIDGGADIIQKRVGPFKIRHHILDMGQCQILSSLFDEVEDRTVATVKDADRFMIKRSEFWSSLSPKKNLSNMLIICLIFKTSVT